MTMKRDQRQAIREEMGGAREERRVAISQFEIREVPNGTGGTSLKFEGYASITCADESDFAHTYEMEDPYGAYEEGVVRGAFSKTLGESADVAFLMNHAGVTMARTKPGTLKLHEDLVGLHVAAMLNPQRSDVQILKAAVDDGALDEMSFAFRVMRQKWSWEKDNGEIDRRWLQEVNLHKGDVAVVNYGANPHTGGLVSMRSRRARAERSDSTAPLVLPDHTTQARAALARLGPTPGGVKPGRVSDATREARRKLAIARYKA
jgi:uncharacterized protein